MREECSSFAEKLAGLFSEIIAQSMTAELLRELDEREVTLSQLQALTRIVEQHPCSIGKLAAELGVTHPAAVRLVDRLAGKGLVHRGVAPGDHRQAAICPTQAGMRLAQLARDERVRRINMVLDGMSPEARQSLIEGMQEFVTTALADAGSLDRLCCSCQALRPEPCDMFPLASPLAAGRLNEMIQARAAARRER